MTTAMLRWRSGMPTMLDWPDLSWLPVIGPEIKVEEFAEKDRYLVRAELPGIDPAKDVQITYTDGALRIEATRTEQVRDKARSEFRYGSFVRMVPLPAGADEKSITAQYDNGILEISVKVTETHPEGRHIPIKGHQPGTGKAAH